MAGPLGGLGEFLFGGSTVNKESTLNAGQQDTLGALTQGSTGAINDLYGTLGGLSGQATSAYEALPDFEQQFQQQYGDPLKQQYDMDLANIQSMGGGELFSGGTTANNFRANQKFNTGLASARAGMMMNERNKQLQSQEAALGRQLNASQLLSSLSTKPLGVKAQENLVSKDPGVLSMISGIGSAVGSITGALSGLGGGGAAAK